MIKIFLALLCFCSIGLPSVPISVYNLDRSDSITYWLAAVTDSGRFADQYSPWVVGPVTIDSITPSWNGTYHGWQVNPTCIDSQAFDTRPPAKESLFYKASLMPSLPYTTGSGVESIVKVKSDPLGVSGSRTFVDIMAVLTVLEEVPASNGSTLLRPPYMGTEKPLYTTADINTDLLRSLTPVGTPPTLAKVAQRFEMVRMEHLLKNQRDMRPKYAYQATGESVAIGTDGYAPQVGQFNAESIARLHLNDNAGDKTLALVRVLQAGLDEAYSIKYGKREGTGNGHDPWHKIMGAFSCAVLGITNISDTIRNAVNLFEEDEYITDSLWGNSLNTELQYWNYVAFGVGDRSHRDVYGYVDGGSPNRAGYQVIVSQVNKGSALIMQLMPEVKAIWGPESTGFVWYIDRMTERGVKFAPDPCSPVVGDTLTQISKTSEYLGKKLLERTNLTDTRIIDTIKQAVSIVYFEYTTDTMGAWTKKDSSTGSKLDIGAVDTLKCVNVLTGTEHRFFRLRTNVDSTVLGWIKSGYTLEYGPDGDGGCIADADESNGVGRFPTYVGIGVDTGQYKIPFVTEMWAAYANSAPEPPAGNVIDRPFWKAHYGTKNDTAFARCSTKTIKSSFWLAGKNSGVVDSSIVLPVGSFDTLWRYGSGDSLRIFQRTVR